MDHLSVRYYPFLEEEMKDVLVMSEDEVNIAQPKEKYYLRFMLLSMMSQHVVYHEVNKILALERNKQYKWFGGSRLSFKQPCVIDTNDLIAMPLSDYMRSIVPLAIQQATRFYYKDINKEVLFLEPLKYDAK